MRAQYHGRQTPEGFLVWDVRKLIALSEGLPVNDVDLATINEFDENYWYQSDDVIPTCSNIADHMNLVTAANLDFPILLCAEGRLMDGMHRVVKAHIEGQRTIPACRFKTTPPPDHIDVNLSDLPYDT
ncbi:MAG: hypothetical protein GKR97_06545 [Rhizobiaceae bacterium]|nr:hypothetical protein [Rhizobiaceae bacterium]